MKQLILTLIALGLAISLGASGEAGEKAINYTERASSVTDGRSNI